MRTAIVTFALVATALADVGCDNTSAGAKRDAEEANAKAQKAAQEASRGVEKAAAEAEKAAKQAEKTAADKVDDLAGEASKTATEEQIALRKRTQKELATINGKIANAEADMKVATSDARVAKEKTVAKLRAARDVLVADLAEMDSVVEVKWLTFKQRVERDLNDASR